MGLWIKNDDGSIEKVAGSGGGGGSFEGEHVLTGDVDNPPEDLAVGQLMWDGVEGGSGGGDAGPHDHDYLPMSGGTLTGQLGVTGSLLFSEGPMPPYDDKLFSIVANASGQGTGSSLKARWLAEGKYAFHFYSPASNKQNLIHRNLRICSYSGESGDLLVEGDVEAWGDIRAYGDLTVEGTIDGTLAFNIADGIDAADVLDRAETATMPVIDDDGVATTDVDVKSITVNEVVTALLAKVKELSAEIEELKAKDRPLKKQAAPRKKAAKKTTTAKTTTAKKEGN